MSKGGSDSTVTQEIDPDVKAAYLGNLDYARTVANQLGTKGFAGYDPLYQQGEAQALAAGAGPGRQQLGTAGALTQAAAGYSPQMIQADQGLVQQYYNPYEQQVIDTSLSDLEQARQKAVQQMGQQATAAKAFGGSRHGVAEALTSGEYGKQAGSMIANLRNQGYQQAMNLAQQQQLANQAAGLQGAQFRLGAANQLGALGQAQTASDLQSAQNFMNLGTARQQFAQQQMDAARNLGLERLGIMQGALGLQPANIGGTTTSPVYQNTGANVLGGALGGASLAGTLGMSAGAGAGLGALLGLI